MKTHTFASLETERLILRRFRSEDEADFSRYRSNPKISRFQLRSFDIDDAHYFIATQKINQPDTPGTWFQMAIERRSDGALIGDCGLRFPAKEVHQVEIGISVAPEHQGNGYAAEALERMLGYIFTGLGKHRAWASTDPQNVTSVKLLEKVGFRREAHHFKSLLIRGEWADDLIYAMLEEEWIQNHKP